MFTGIVEEVGKILSIKHDGDGFQLTIQGNRVMDDLAVDNSIAVDGVCQTVTSVSSNTFNVFAMKETLKKTTFGHYSSGSEVNLERAVLASSRLGGHIVQGHVDCTGIINSIKQVSKTYLIEIRLPEQWSKLTVTHGSITMNGVSLTIASKHGVCVTVSLIPFTLDATNLKNLRKGSSVNVETDIIGKYLYEFKND